jgi:hypothetical protein
MAQKKTKQKLRNRKQKAKRRSRRVKGGVTDLVLTTVSKIIKKDKMNNDNIIKENINKRRDSTEKIHIDYRYPIKNIRNIEFRKKLLSEILYNIETTYINNYFKDFEQKLTEYTAYVNPGVEIDAAYVKLGVDEYVACVKLGVEKYEKFSDLAKNFKIKEFKMDDNTIHTDIINTIHTDIINDTFDTINILNDIHKKIEYGKSIFSNDGSYIYCTDGEGSSSKYVIHFRCYYGNFNTKLNSDIPIEYITKTNNAGKISFVITNDIGI